MAILNPQDQVLRCNVLQFVCFIKRTVKHPLQMSFCLLRCCSLPLRYLFRCMPSSIESDDHHQEPPLGARQAQSKRDREVVRWNQPSELRDYKWEMTNLMNASILHHIEVSPPRLRCVYIISNVNSMLHDGIYEVTMGRYPTCICIDFILMLTSSIGK